jgi:pyrrolidone-carboxylate peptidase
LKVAAKDVDEYLARLARELEQETAALGGGHASTDAAAIGCGTAAYLGGGPGAAVTAGRVVLLHLGVASTAKEFRIESRAYNCANFRVMDENGWCPQMQEIEPGLGLSSCVGSRLPLGAVCERLALCGYNVVVSEDAGQFVCNWIYHRACSLAERFGLEVVFVHVPPFEVYDEGKQQAFLRDTMRAITACARL